MTSLDALVTQRVQPLVANRSVKTLQLGKQPNMDLLLANLVDPSYPQAWRRETLKNTYMAAQLRDKGRISRCFMGYWVERAPNGALEARLSLRGKEDGATSESGAIWQADDWNSLRRKINSERPSRLKFLVSLSRLLIFACQGWRYAVRLVFGFKRLSTCATEQREEEGFRYGYNLSGGYRTSRKNRKGSGRKLQ